MGSEKRLLPALLVSFAAVFALTLFFPPEPRKAQPSNDALRAPAAADVADAASVEVVADDGAAPAVEPWSEWFTFGTPGVNGYMAVQFDSLGGSVAEIRLGNYFDRVDLTDEEKADPDHWVHLVEPAIEQERRLLTLMTRAARGSAAHEILRVEPSAAHWEAEPLAERTGVRFTHRDPSGVVLTKTIRAVPGENQLAVEFAVSTSEEAQVGKVLDLRLVASVGMLAERATSDYAEPRAVAARPGGDPQQVNVDLEGDDRIEGEEFVTGELAYVGSHNKYFAAILRPAGEPEENVLYDATRIFVFDMPWALAQKAAGAEYADYRKGFRDILAEGKLRIPVPAVGTSKAYEYVLFAGPKDKSHFTERETVLEDVMREDLGFFDGIASVILGYLRFLHGVVGNWGVAIILMTLTVRLLLFPLQRKMQTSMARHATKMKRVQPKLDAVKEKYKNDPKKLREEQARLFQQEGAMPPVGGCLPIFLQIPIFFGLFSALRVSFDLRHAPFVGWIRDLSEPDRMFRTGLDGSIPLLPDLTWFNLLPLLMIVLWVLQQKVMPKPATMSEQQAQMQKIMLWMPVIFGVFLYDYASGLSLYMITTSIFGIAEATVIRKVWPIDETEQPKKKSRFMQRLEQLQEQAMQMQEQQRRQQGGQKGGPKGGAKRGPKR